MKNVIVIGGGLAGLSAALNLSQSGFKVSVLESSPKLGGRAYSFNDHRRGVIDNGQHILMGNCNYAIDYLRKIGRLKNLDKQNKLYMKTRQNGGVEHKLEAKGSFYPFNLLLGILTYKALSRKERFGLAAFLTRIFLSENPELETLSAKEWLEGYGTSDKSFLSFWNLIINATMNTSSEKASAATLNYLLKEIFFKGNFAATLLVPGTDLSDLFCNTAGDVIIKNKGNISFSERVVDLKYNYDNIIGIETNETYYKDFDYVVSAVPYHSFKKFATGIQEIIPKIEFSYSPIVTSHIWLENNPFSEKYYALIDSDIHWLFNHGNYITTVTSDAGYLASKNKDEIGAMAIREVENYFPEFDRESVTDFRVIKEKKATFVPDSFTEFKRKNIPARIGNLFLAGDWTNTGLPGTIEGAIKSGKMAAEGIIQSVN